MLYGSSDRGFALFLASILKRPCLLQSNGCGMGCNFCPSVITGACWHWLAKLAGHNAAYLTHGNIPRRISLFHPAVSLKVFCPATLTATTRGAASAHVTRSFVRPLRTTSTSRSFDLTTSPHASPEHVTRQFRPAYFPSQQHALGPADMTWLLPNRSLKK